MSPISGANVSPAARGGVGKLGNSGASRGCCTAYTSSSSTGGVIDQYLPAAASSALKLLRPKSESANSPMSLGLQVEAMLIVIVSASVSLNVTTRFLTLTVCTGLSGGAVPGIKVRPNGRESGHLPPVAGAK